MVYKGEAWEKFGLFCIFTVLVVPQIYVYVETHRSVYAPPKKKLHLIKKISATHWKWFLLYFIHHFQVFVAEEYSGYLTLPSYQNWAASWYFEPFISRPLPPSSPATHSHVHTLDLTAINYCTSEICHHSAKPLSTPSTGVMFPQRAFGNVWTHLCLSWLGQDG